MCLLYFTADEAKELKDEIDRAQRAASDADKQRKRLAMEKDELVSALEDAESALEQEEAKVLNAQNDIAHIRQEMERRLAEKDEDFEATRSVYLDCMKIREITKKSNKQKYLAKGRLM